MNDSVSEKIEAIRSMGMVYSFDGLAVADFLVQLDKVVEVKTVHFGESRLTVMTGPLKLAQPEDVVELVPLAAMLGVAAAFAEHTGEGSEFWFEWILPKDFAGLK